MFYPDLLERLGECEIQVRKTDEELVPIAPIILATTPKGCTPDVQPQSAEMLSLQPASPKVLDKEHKSASETDSMAAEQSKAATKKRKLLKNRITRLRIICNFIETDLKSCLNLREQISKRSLETISFDSLWHLFRPGDVVFTNDRGMDALYVVYAITGGQQIKREDPGKYKPSVFQPPHHITDTDSESDSDSDSGRLTRSRNSSLQPQRDGFWSPLTIDCYKMGCDGPNVGAVRVCKEIGYYRDQCRITDLPIYPLQFHKDEKNISSKLEKRGRKFVTCNGHKNHNGITISKRQDELSGDVFVDLTEYYRQHPHRRPRLGELSTKSANPREHSEFVPPPVKLVRELFDKEVDQYLTDKFLGSERGLVRCIKSKLLAETKPGTDEQPINAEIAYEYLRLLTYRIPVFSFRTRNYSQSQPNN